MPAPKDWGAPVRRPGAILTADWVGDDDFLRLELGFLDEYGQVGSLELRTTNAAEGIGDICLPSRATIINISDETMISHARMAQWIAGGGAALVPGSTEWLAAFQDEGSIPDFQTAIGNVRVYDARAVSEIEFEFDLRKKGMSLTKTIRTDYGVFLHYRLDPREAIRCVAGGIEYLHPSFVHDHPTQVLSESQRDQIVESVLGAYGASGLNAPWM